MHCLVVGEHREQHEVYHMAGVCDAIEYIDLMHNGKHTQTQGCSSQSVCADLDFSLSHTYYMFSSILRVAADRKCFCAIKLLVNARGLHLCMCE